MTGGPFELKRVDQGDGFHHVTVAFSATDTATIVVPTSNLDQPGYLDMIAVAHRRYTGAINVKEGLPR